MNIRISKILFVLIPILAVTGLATLLLSPTDEQQIRQLIPQATAAPFSDIVAMDKRRRFDKPTGTANCPLALVSQTKEFRAFPREIRSQDLDLRIRPGMALTHARILYQAAYGMKAQSNRTVWNTAVRHATSLAEDVGLTRRPGPKIPLIRDHQIKRFTCEVTGDRASGVIEFASHVYFGSTLPCYSGSVEYTARRDEDGWQIVEFRLPRTELKTVRTNKGQWRLSLPDNTNPKMDRP